MPTQYDQYGNEIIQPLTGAPSPIGAAIPTPSTLPGLTTTGQVIDPGFNRSFAPSINAVVSSSEVNQAISNPATLPPDAQNALEIGQLGRLEGDKTVYLRTGTGEVRGFTTPQSLINAGFNSEQVRIVLPDVLKSFKAGMPITEAMGKMIPYQLQIDEVRRSMGVPSREEEKTASQKIIDEYKTLPTTRAAERKKLLDDFRVTSLNEKVSLAQQEVADTEKIYELAEEKLRGSPGVLSVIIEGNVALLRRQRDIEVKAKFAKVTALSGEASRAFTMASQAIQDAMADESIRLQGLQFALTEARANRQDLDQDALGAFQFVLQERQATIAREQKLADEKTALYLEFSQLYPRAKLSPGMTLDEMFSEVKKYASEKEELDLSLLRSQIAASDRSNRPSTTKGERTIPTEAGELTAAQIRNQEYNYLSWLRKGETGTVPFKDWVETRDYLIMVVDPSETASLARDLDPRAWLSEEDRKAHGYGSSTLSEFAETINMAKEALEQGGGGGTE